MRTLVAANLTPLLAAAFALLAAIPIFFWPLLPLQDFPDWVFQGQLLQSWLEGRLSAQYVMASYIPPNSLTTVILGLLGGLLGVDVTARVLVWVTVLLVPFAAARLATVPDVRSPLTWVPLLFAFSYPLLHGNLNSALALGLLLVFTRTLLLHADNHTAPGVGYAVFAGTSVYVTHGISYAIWLGLIVVVPMSRKMRARWALGTIPSLIMAFHFCLSKSATGGDALQWRFESAPAWALYKLDTIYKQLSAFSLFDPFFVSPAFLGALLLANILIVLGLVYVAAEKTRLALRDKDPVPSVTGRCTAIVGLTVAFFVAPRGFIGLVNPGERLVLPLILLALSLPYRPRLPSLLRRAALPAVAALVVFQLGFIGIQGHRAASAMRSLVDEVAGLHGPLALIAEIRFEDADVPPRSSLHRSYAALPRHYPLARAPMYAAYEQQLVVPIFETGLFRAAAPNAPRVRDIASASASNSSIFIAGEGKRVAEIARRISRHRERSRGTYHRLLVLHDENSAVRSTNHPSLRNAGTSTRSTSE